MQISEYRKWKRVIVVQAWEHGIMEEYIYNMVTVNDTVFLMWLMLRYYLQILVGHFVYANEENPGS